ncbi:MULTISPECIES: DUF5987 family protein [unclassified Isoptericola]|uniref:DUF5987 family protein n=1 Tax=unclassified Isoptericola TaxID=2623355 RepID=UPI002712DDAF|nr:MULTISPECIES: DUF5987 family protein [unclassified Isoptericola]MDO8145908.1 DUF5987 family protein [Isoptericola sp. 178]MDO8147759.1 DUF5987 family protein [Isoptericola sp. b515]
MSPTDPISRPRVAPRGARPRLTAQQTTALEACADTVVPGRRRHDDDVAIAGVSDTPGAVEAGALEVLTDPATGIEDGVGEMAEMLDERAASWARAEGLVDVDRFADLSYQDRRRLLALLTGAEEPAHELWFLLALFATMAYDSAPHRETAEAVLSGAPGLTAMGFAPPSGGRWRASDPTYTVPMARLHPATDPRTGSLT